MNYAQQQRNPGKHLTGLSVVVVLHIILGWAIVNGLAKRIVDVVKGPLETKLIEEVKPPPPPPPRDLPPPPKTPPPPPSFVPPPEVQVTQTIAAPTITTTTVAPPPAPVTLSVAPPVAAPPPVPTAAAPARIAPQLNFNGCAKPEYTSAAARAETTGTVIVSFTMDVTGQISEAHVEKSSGSSREHKQLDRATVEAVLACKGKPGSVDGRPERLTGRVEYVWKMD